MCVHIPVSSYKYGSARDSSPFITFALWFQSALIIHELQTLQKDRHAVPISDSVRVDPSAAERERSEEREAHDKDHGIEESRGEGKHTRMDTYQEHPYAYTQVHTHIHVHT